MKKVYKQRSLREQKRDLEKALKNLNKRIKKISVKKGKRDLFKKPSKYVEGQLGNLSAKKQKAVYRDIKGRIVSEKLLNGKKKVSWEIWRYSENSRKWKKLDFGNKWIPKYTKRKKPMTKKQIATACINRYAAHNIEIRMINGEVYAYTASP